MSATASSEPERVQQITTGLFAQQSGASWQVDGGSLTLTGGADRRDDCAWFEFEGSGSLVMGSDYVRGTEFLLFQLGVLDYYDVGYYLAAANISDVAAMGARPTALTSVVRYPRDLPDEQFTQIMSGIRDCCVEYGCLNVGGDIGTAERVIVSASAIGIAPRGKVLTRSGARPGDSVVLSDKTGIALAAMIYFEGRARSGWRELPSADEERLAQAWKRIEPEVALGTTLAEQQVATSCQDTSDGLRATIEQLEAASGVRIDVDLDAVPVDDVVRRVAELADADPVGIVFGGSVDFRLLYTAAPASLSRIAHPGYVIGEVRANQTAESSALPGVAWTHQADPLAGYRRS